MTAGAAQSMTGGKGVSTNHKERTREIPLLPGELRKKGDFFFMSEGTYGAVSFPPAREDRYSTGVFPVTRLKDFEKCATS